MATTGDPGVGTDPGRTLYVRFREGDDEGLERTLGAIDRGETPAPHFEVVYHDPADVHRVTRPQNLAVLRAIVRHEPGSIRETARIVDRDVRGVHRDLTELADLHLIELVEEAQSKRPRVWYDRIQLELPLSDASSEAFAAT